MTHADFVNSTYSSKAEMLEQTVASYEALSTDTDNWVANLANCSSLVWHGFHSIGVPINWAGFYIASDPHTLTLGPFQGKVACQVIEVGKGVCGTAASTGQTQLVVDVHKFPGHIACDGDTNSEIVVPLMDGKKCLGVLDIDCLALNGFDEQDQQFLEQLCGKIVESCKF
ncbi:methionine-R-sulfoxide reductase [Yamadazyma tenuis]|uniref:GAF domain-like protein n=1 Tax=Candida tenuis (strain ATCC 10573 / BCRC 21748 / CBS 615 / JCM 9827 / NBRC 10315 / NRRL Y-1498 / VKM Y-70) TaxID=590646 RepID=G3B488_CANTC|nr:GAF domain-like protein [Yamadazyma tenuis ATCC 10573]XP_006686612.1 uncharacterized protein CANTEDRAFT_113949 [Yamadazyma tenuis ATCC 10573]EGV64297.1 GAF domain-like protein [Yamadazyma tenuis ATCC 10573]EGV64298.1 hypothetical protein CANTEDRAFT_113949 [Yamadazyma tenuis ATCC 10573]WEJ96460.1 methionine-R-sulfoxide reductase [Yamadazyma tenuis]